MSLLPPQELDAKRQMRAGPYHEHSGLDDGDWWKQRVDRTKREEESRRLEQAVLQETR